MQHCSSAVPQDAFENIAQPVGQFAELAMHWPPFAVHGLEPASSAPPSSPFVGRDGQHTSPAPAPHENGDPGSPPGHDPAMQTWPLATHSLALASFGIAASDRTCTSALASIAMAASTPPALGEDEVDPPQEAATSAAKRWNVRAPSRVDACIRTSIARPYASRGPRANARHPGRDRANGREALRQIAPRRDGAVTRR